MYGSESDIKERAFCTERLFAFVGDAHASLASEAFKRRGEIVEAKAPGRCVEAGSSKGGWTGASDAVRRKLRVVFTRSRSMYRIFSGRSSPASYC